MGVGEVSLDVEAFLSHICKDSPGFNELLLSSSELVLTSP